MPKMNDIPACPPIPNTSASKLRNFQIELITPLFGGGVETRVNDASFPIRPTAIRGQLQLWWRATVGAQFATRDELRKAQSEIWGSTERASRVQVRVGNVNVSEPEPCAEFQKDNKNPEKYRSMPTWYPPFDDALPYALFPFQGQLADGRKRIEVEPASSVRKGSFCLILHCPDDLWQRVEPAVWAWVNFGGLGSRTRRGCGAIFCKELAPSDTAELAAKWKKYMPVRFPARDWPTLAEAILVRTAAPPGEAIQIWNWLIELFKYFRQGPSFARNKGIQHNRPGRSRWPEPETIREKAGADRQRSGHQRLPSIPDDAFPRAEFGLPIIYELRGDGEPPKTSLQPIQRDEPSDRMASPLILKPLALTIGRSVPVIVRLSVPHLNSVVLMRGATEIGRFDDIAIRAPRLATTGDQPMSYSQSGSALEAFMNYAVQKKDFTEVTR